MKIGILNSKELGLFPEMTYTRIGGRIPLPPDSTENGALCWKWQNHHATGIELHITLPEDVYLATLETRLGDEAPERVEVLDANGVCIGSCCPEVEKNSFSVTVGAVGKRFVLRLIPRLRDMVLTDILLYGATDTDTRFLPTPKRFTQHNGSLSCGALATVTAAEDADCRFAAAYFAERAKERWQLTTNTGEGLLLQKSEAVPQNGYQLQITENGARIIAADRLGLLYAIERLFELESNGILPCCTIEDAPYKEMRGVHMYLPCKKELGFTKALIKNILIPCHYNQIFLEFAGGMRYESHPEISEGWLRGNQLAREGKIPPFPHGAVADGELLEKEDARELCDFIHELGLELIPEVQSLGHVQYITYAHPDIAEVDPNADKNETDERAADVPPSLFYKHSYCPQNKKSYEIIHDLIDEIVEVARPKRFVHMGHDEVYQLGLCPKCREIAPDKLFEADVMEHYRYLAKKGLRMMLWGDMVQPVSKYRCFPCLERLPKDIVWLDFIWYFHMDKDIEENLLQNGSEVMIGNLYSSHFPRYEKRMAAENMLGGEVSFWAVTRENDLAREGKLYDLLYTAEMLWSESYREAIRPFYAKRIAAKLPRLRAAIRGTKLRTAATPLPLPEKAHLDAFDAIPLYNEISVPVNGTANALRFLHTTLYREKRIAWKPLVQIGSYTVAYEDGSSIEIPVTYDGNVRCYRYRYAEPLREGYYRHEGYVCTWEADPVTKGRSADGTPITLYALEWENPHPKKKIDRIICAERADSAAGLCLCGLEALQ